MHKFVDEALHAFDSRLRTHDFRMVQGTGHTNLIFDIVLPDDIRNLEKQVTQYLSDRLATEGKTYYTVITFDSSAFDPHAKS